MDLNSQIISGIYHRTLEKEKLRYIKNALWIFYFEVIAAGILIRIFIDPDIIYVDLSKARDRSKVFKTFIIVFVLLIYNITASVYTIKCPADSMSISVSYFSHFLLIVSMSYNYPFLSKIYPEYSFFIVYWIATLIIFCLIFTQIK